MISPTFTSILFAVFVSCGLAFAITGKKLTVPAAIAGALLCLFIFLGVGWVGVALMTAFFAMGTLATSWKKNTKEAIGLAQENKGRRNTGQVLANAGAGGLLGLLAIILPQHASLFLYLMAAAFSSATADTVSSELGSVYGKRFYDMLSLQLVEGGPDGVISIEGILFGMAGSLVIAVIYALDKDFHFSFAWIIAAGTIGNLADSYLGATLERKGVVGNDVVNCLNTVIAVAAAFLLQSL